MPMSSDTSETMATAALVIELSLLPTIACWVVSPMISNSTRSKVEVSARVRRQAIRKMTSSKRWICGRVCNDSRTIAEEAEKEATAIVTLTKQMNPSRCTRCSHFTSRSDAKDMDPSLTAGGGRRDEGVFDDERFDRRRRARAAGKHQCVEAPRLEVRVRQRDDRRSARRADFNRPVDGTRYRGSR